MAKLFNIFEDCLTFCPNILISIEEPIMISKLMHCAYPGWSILIQIVLFTLLNGNQSYFKLCMSAYKIYETKRQVTECKGEKTNRNKINPVVELFFRYLYLKILTIVKCGLQIYFWAPSWKSSVHKYKDDNLWEKNKSRLFGWWLLYSLKLVHQKKKKRVLMLCNKHVTTKYNNRAVVLNQGQFCPGVGDFW